MTKTNATGQLLPLKERMNKYQQTEWVRQYREGAKAAAKAKRAVKK